MSRRDQLLQHMTSSIRERGLGATTVEGVLGASDVTAGSMYHFFPDGKEALASASVEAAGLKGAAQLADVLDSSPDPTHGTEVFFTALAIEMEENGYRYGCPVGVPSTEAAAIESVRAAGASAFLSWITLIAASLEDKGVAPDRAQAVARLVVAAYEGASTLARTMKDTSVIYDTMELVKEVIGGFDAET